MVKKNLLIGVLSVCMTLGFATADASGKTTKASSPKAKSSQVVRKKTVATKPVARKANPVKLSRRATPAEADFDREGNPLIRSSAFMVQDLSSGEILLEKNAHTAAPIASISKLMTAMVVLDAQLDLNETLRIADEDVDRLKGTSSRLPVGTQLTREEMLRLALMASENRAASALARHYPGGQAAFIEAMNAKSQQLGLHDTRFEDSTGLNKHNISSPRDLALMVAAASRYPLIREFTTATDYSVSVRGREQAFHNTNALVKSPDWQISVSKTGYISEAGKCLVMQAWFNNKPVAIVLLDSWGKFTRLGDANRIKRWMDTALSQQRQAAVLQLLNGGGPLM